MKQMVNFFPFRNIIHRRPQNKISPFCVSVIAGLGYVQTNDLNMKSGYILLEVFEDIYLIQLKLETNGYLKLLEEVQKFHVNLCKNKFLALHFKLQDINFVINYHNYLQ